jgi:hypothetical protein
LNVESEDEINESKVSDTKKNRIGSAHVMSQHTASLGTCSLDISLELNDLFTLKLKEQFQFITDSWIFEFSESVATQTQTLLASVKNMTNFKNKTIHALNIQNEVTTINEENGISKNDCDKGNQYLFIDLISINNQQYELESIRSPFNKLYFL